MIVRLVALLLHCQTDVHLCAMGAFHHRILLLDDAQHLLAIECLHVFTLVWLAETKGDYLGYIFLLHISLIQGLDASDLFVVIPIRCMQLVEFIQHLRIELIIVDVTRIIDELSFGNRDAQITAAACSIGQRMRIVGCCHE